MKAVTVLLVIALTVACASRPPGPREIEKAVIAIKVTKPRWLFEDYAPRWVYFVRLEADSQIRQKRVFQSNYRSWSGDYVYLINASAGRYAAIGAEGYHGLWGPPYWYFPASMIAETIVTVEPSGVAFMGEFEVSGDLQFDDADDTQKHYFNIFSRPLTRNWLEDFTNWLDRLGNSFFIAEYRKDQHEMATQRFLQLSRPLAEAGWRAWTMRAPAEDGDNKGISERPDQQNGDK